MEEYYKLTDKDIKIISKYIKDEDFDELFDFIENGICVVAGIHNVNYMKNLVKEYGSHVMLNNCNNCARNTVCTPLVALYVCGEGLTKWEGI